MIALEIDGVRYTKFNQYRVQLRFNSIASTFSFNFYDDGGQVSKRLRKPGKYVSAVVKYVKDDGTELTLITGTVLSHTKISSAKSQYISVAGYSKPGVLEDCQVPTSLYPLQSDGKTLRQITEQLIKPFGVELIVHSSVAGIVDKPISVSTAKNSETIQSYLYELAYNRNLVLSHDVRGRLLITKGEANSEVKANFVKGVPASDMTLEFDGQSMHSEITVVRQADSEGGNSGTATLKNPYVSAFRPCVKVQTSGDDIDIKEAAARELARELSALKVVIETDRWELNGRILMPNSIVTILNPDIGLNKSTRMFVEAITYSGDETVNQAQLTCVVPEVYNGGTSPKNIFA